MSPWKIDCIGSEGLRKYLGTTIHLVTPNEFEKLDNGVLLISIHGEEKIKGQDNIDDDTRYGHLAFGIPS